MKEKLLNNDELEWSAVVANNSMNRERIAIGINSYDNEINLNTIDFITQRKKQESIQWTDLCCGSGNALIQASNHFKEDENLNLSIIGIDLVAYFSSYEQNDILTLKQLNLSNWEPNKKSDLITIVHGLHYIGNKIELILNAAKALKKDGVFIGNLDVENVLIEGVKNPKKTLLSFFEKNKIDYNKRKKIITIQGYQKIQSDFVYLGADDKAGPNYTGQEVVNSYYKLAP